MDEQHDADASQKRRTKIRHSYVARYGILVVGLVLPWSSWWTLRDRPLNDREIIGLATWPLAMVGAWAWVTTASIYGMSRYIGERMDPKREVRDYRIARWATTLSLIAVLWPKDWPREPSEAAQLWFDAWPVYLAVIWFLCTVMIRHYRRRAAELAEKRG